MSQSDKLDNLKKRTNKNGKINPNSGSRLDENNVGKQDNFENQNLESPKIEGNFEDGLKDNFQDNSESKESNNIKEENIQLEIAISSLKAEVKDWQQRTARLSAEIANLQKQHELDSVGAKKLGKKNVASGLIIFLNTLNLAFSFAPKSDDVKVQSFITTLVNSFEKLISDLRLTGVEIISPKTGDDFNPEIMAALDVVGNSDGQPKVSKIAVLGYKIDGQVVQPASVLLS